MSEAAGVLAAAKSLGAVNAKEKRAVGDMPDDGPVPKRPMKGPTRENDLPEVRNGRGPAAGDRRLRAKTDARSACRR